MKIYLFVILFFVPIWLKAQIDTTKAVKTINPYIFCKDTIHRTNKEVGLKIPHLVLFNLTNDNVPIKLYTDNQTCSNFNLDPISKNLFRCDGINQIYIIVYSGRSNDIEAKIYINRVYKIYYNSGAKIDIAEIP